MTEGVFMCSGRSVSPSQDLVKGRADAIVAAVLFAAATLLYGLLPRHPRPV